MMHSLVGKSFMYCPMQSSMLAHPANTLCARKASFLYTQDVSGARLACLTSSSLLKVWYLLYYTAVGYGLSEDILYMFPKS